MRDAEYITETFRRVTKGMSAMDIASVAAHLPEERLEAIEQFCRDASLGGWFQTLMEFERTHPATELSKLVNELTKGAKLQENN